MNPIVQEIRNFVNVLCANFTAARAGKIDNLDAAITTRASAANVDVVLSTRAAETTPVLATPIAGGLSSGSSAWGEDLSLVICGLLSASTNTSTYTDVVNYTGKGVLEFCAQQNSYTGAVTHNLDILIDGAVVYSNALTGSANYQTSCPVGIVGPSVAGLGAVPFKTSLQIRHKMSASVSGGKTFYKFRKTA